MIYRPFNVLSRIKHYRQDRHNTNKNNNNSIKNIEIRIRKDKKDSQ